MQAIKAIDTTYYRGRELRGRFRSRLEARWAVFFDVLGVTWEYEKEGYDFGKAGWYLPDFWLPQVGMWAEVKGERFKPNELEKCYRLAMHTEHPCLILEGLPSNRSYFKYLTYGPGHDILMNDLGEIAEETDGSYPGGDFHIPLPWSDAIIDETYLDEDRFFGNTAEGQGGYPDGFAVDCLSPLGIKAINAARAARFEHGEQPSI